MPSIGGLKFDDVLDDLDAGKATALSDLRDMLKAHDGNPHLTEIKDKSILHILQKIFPIAKKERSAWGKATKRTTKELAARKATTVAETLRFVVEYFLPHMKGRSVYAVLDHVIDILPTAEGNWCQPFMQDYFKVLDRMFAYQAHVENLRSESWKRVADFLLQAYELLTEDVEAEDESLHASTSLSRSMTQRPGKKTLESSDRRQTVVSCLSHLITPPSCPLAEFAGRLTELMCGILQDRHVRSMHVAAIQALNVCIKRLSCDLDFMKKVTNMVLPIFPSLLGSLLKVKDLTDEALASLVYLRPHIIALIDSSSGKEILVHVDSLFEVLWEEYLVKPPRDQLNLHDLFLDPVTWMPGDLMPMQVPSFALRQSTTFTESNWTLLSILAFLLNGIQLQAMLKRSDQDAYTEPSLKRRKTLSRLDDILAKLSSKALPMEKKCALQLLCFFISTPKTHIDITGKIVDLCHRLTSSDDPDVADWATIALTCITTQSQASSLCMRHRWLEIWRLCTRNITAPSTCRSSCHLAQSLLSLRLVAFDDVKDSLDALLSAVGSNGPAIICESSLMFWTTITATRAFHLPGQATGYGYEQLSAWLCNKWDPSSFESKTHAHQLLTEAPSHLISHILCRILGQDKHTRLGAPFTELQSLGQTWLWCRKNAKLSNWLLEAQDAFPMLSEPYTHSTRTVNDMNTTSLRPIRSDLAESILVFLTNQLEQASQRWSHAIIDKAAFINVDMIQVALGLCLVSAQVTNVIRTCHGRRADILHKKQSEFQKQILKLAMRPETICGDVAVLQAIGPFLPRLHSVDTPVEILADVRPFASIINQLSEAFDGCDLRAEIRNSSVSFETEDDAFGDNARSQTFAKALGRRDATLGVDIRSFAAPMATYLHLCAEILKEDVHVESAYLVKRGFTKRLLALPVSEFLAIRPLIDRILLSRLGMDPEAVQDLLNIVGVKMLGDYSWDGCDSSIAFLIEAMIGTMSLWTDRTLPELYQDGTELYRFLINDLIKDGQCSTAATIIPLADMLYRLLHIDSTYAETIEGQESTRTTLLSLLRTSDTASQHHIAERLPELFVGYTLNTHEIIYNDVVEVLPNDVKDAEKIYARLVALTHIGITWNNLLRQCIYSIFETAGNLTKINPEIETHASACIDFVVQSLQLENGKHLFQLFSSHLLHSWLEDKTLESVPYKIFGFANLHDLAISAQDNIVSFSVMRSTDKGLQTLADALQRSPKDLIISSFAGTSAHCIGYDVSHADKIGTAVSAEVRVKQIAGAELYADLLRTHFQEIISIFFLHLEDEDNIEKYLTRRKDHYAHALEALRRMNKFGHPDLNSSQTQQPSWRPKYFLEQIEKMCRRTGKSSKSMWTVHLVVAVARAMFNDMHAAYGPTHACRVIQRIRILVCLSGDEALAGYPLEVLIHGLRPFATDKQSADIALPIFRYLLDYGTPYLVQIPWYTAGVCVTMLLSIRGLLESTQDSTTQESAHKAMLSKADDFKNWIVTWTDTLRKTIKDDQSASAYSRLMFFATRSTGKCSGLKGAAESELLLLLLGGLRSRSKSKSSDQTPGLNESSSKTCLSILCRDFLPAKPLREDILGDPVEAARFAPLVWTSLKAPYLSRNYSIWAARVLGQAYRQTGSIDREIDRESGLRPLFGTFERSGRAGSPLETKERLMALICQQLWSESSRANGLAETALNEILHSSANREEIAFVTRSIPESVADQFMVDTDLVARSCRTNRNFNPSGTQEIFARNAELSAWAKEVVETLLHLVGEDPMLDALLPFLDAQMSLAKRVFPYVVHLVLCLHADRHSEVRNAISAGFNARLKQVSAANIPQTRLLLDTYLYLRCQRLPNEGTIFDRNSWLDLDFQTAANAAHFCGMFKTGLMLVEINHTTTNDTSRRTSRRSSVINDDEPKPLPAELLDTIFRAIEEPDAFYGVEQAADLDAIADRLEYEGDGLQSLLYRGAQLDTMHRSSGGKKSDASSYLLSSLTRLNLSSLVAHFATAQTTGKDGVKANNSLTKAAMKLGQWDLPSPINVSSADDIIYRTLQSISNLSQTTSLRNIVATGLMDIFGLMKNSTWALPTIVEGFRCLASLSAIDSITYLPDVSVFEESITDLLHPKPWIESTSQEAVVPLLVAQEAFAGILLRNSQLRRVLNVSSAQAILTEAHVNLYSSRMYRSLDMMQESLSSITYLSQLCKRTQGSGITFDAAVRRETADVLWARGETLGSIKTLQGLSNDPSLDSQSVTIGNASCLADLAHHMSYARLERPEDILNKYLRRAHVLSKEPARISEAGKVHHEYATHCHNQLDNQDLKDDLKRAENNARESGIAMKALRPFVVSNSSSKDSKEAEKELRRHKSWNQLATAEVARLRKDRQKSLLSGLEHYLQSLAASDDYDTDVVRFLALWFAHIDDSCAHGPVGKYAPHVPSKKFISLMNQLSSRLQDSGDDFHKVLGDIVLRVCRDHPYHGMYHIYAGSNTSGGHDSQAQSRQGAAEGISKRLDSDKSIGPIWQSVARSNELYQRMAKLRDSKQFRAGAKLKMDGFEVMKKVAKEVPKLGVPPITLSIGIRDDMRYSDVAKVTKFDPVFRVAGGLSAPKIVICSATNGRKYRQLFKGGSDDLRQDAIMEQVFEQVTKLLKFNKATRQRGLRIRTYKVVPLDANGGAIEFVEPTISFSDYLTNAHTKYHPKDMKWEVCRHKLTEVQDNAHDQKTTVFKEVCSKINPVLRHFFFENFEDPDDWFDARLAYTRSTAAISVLGHVLGLGDRHCQNILLDIITGEVVHIDLGVAFEAGRILPKPETVPFRLTRDVVDGFGILKTEGVFRRCCEFTLEALRENKATILTLLNVLRYDPLYSWSMSPLRAKRVQNEEESRAAEESSLGISARLTRRSTGGAGELNADANLGSKEKKQEDQGGEADRALSTVERKLAAGLSVSATVNELIQQATDEKNLAQLFVGWAAFA